MKQKEDKSKQLAQNKIDYIVYSNPKEAGAILYDYGYEIPNTHQDLAKAIKLLIKKEGIQIIEELLKIHPDSKAILSVNKEAQEDHFCSVCNSSYNPEDNYCGSCGHDNYNSDFSIKEYQEKLSKMSTIELKTFYGVLMNNANSQPNNKQLADQLHLTWGALSKRLKLEETEKLKNKEKQKEGSFFQKIFRSEIAIASIILLTGILIGTSVKKSSSQSLTSN